MNIQIKKLTALYYPIPIIFLCGESSLYRIKNQIILNTEGSQSIMEKLTFLKTCLSQQDDSIEIIKDNKKCKVIYKKYFVNIYKIIKNKLIIKFSYKMRDCDNIYYMDINFDNNSQVTIRKKYCKKITGCKFLGQFIDSCEKGKFYGTNKYTFINLYKLKQMNLKLIFTYYPYGEVFKDLYDNKKQLFVIQENKTIIYSKKYKQGMKIINYSWYEIKQQISNTYLLFQKTFDKNECFICNTKNKEKRWIYFESTNQILPTKSYIDNNIF